MPKTHTNATPYAIPPAGNTTNTHTVREEGGVKTDGKCVEGCVMCGIALQRGKSISLLTSNLHLRGQGMHW